MSFLQAVVAKKQKYSITRSLQESMFSTVACSWWGLQAEPMMPLICKVFNGSWDHRPTPVATNQGCIFEKDPIYIYHSLWYYSMLYCIIILYFITIVYIYIQLLDRYIYIYDKYCFKNYVYNMGLVTFETLWSRNVFELANLYSFFGYDAAYPELAPFKTSKKPKEPQIRFSTPNTSPLVELES